MLIETITLSRYEDVLCEAIVTRSYRMKYYAVVIIKLQYLGFMILIACEICYVNVSLREDIVRECFIDGDRCTLICINDQRCEQIMLRRYNKKDFRK